MFHLQYYLVAAVIPTLSDMCVYVHTHTHTYSSQCGDAGQAKEIKKETAVYATCQENLSACHFGFMCHRFTSPDLEGWLEGRVGGLIAR